MKAELPVIANQHGAVKVLNNSVHTACHVLGVEMFKTSSKWVGLGLPVAKRGSFPATGTKS